jgi:hypothetical protein
MAGGYPGDVRFGLFDLSLTVEGADGTERREIADRDDFARVLRHQLGIVAGDDLLDAAWERLTGAVAAQKV